MKGGLQTALFLEAENGAWNTPYVKIAQDTNTGWKACATKISV
jgi:hypothetical protein